MTIRHAVESDRMWIAEVLRARWAGTKVVTRGRLIDALSLPCLIAEQDGRRWGLCTYEVRGDECEIITLDALARHGGVGSGLLDTVTRDARAAGCARLRVMATNDNLDALRFYQRRGFRLAELRPGALEQSRALKPAIPAAGEYGIPLRDELDLVADLDR